MATEVLIENNREALVVTGGVGCNMDMDMDMDMGGEEEELELELMGWDGMGWGYVKGGRGR